MAENAEDSSSAIEVAAILIHADILYFKLFQKMMTLIQRDISVSGKDILSIVLPTRLGDRLVVLPNTETFPLLL